MRKDEEGNACPGTLREYRDLCAAIREDSAAVAFLDRKIEKEGRDSEVAVPDWTMRALLMPMLAEVAP